MTYFNPLIHPVLIQQVSSVFSRPTERVLLHVHRKAEAEEKHPRLISSQMGQGSARVMGCQTANKRAGTVTGTLQIEHMRYKDHYSPVRLTKESKQARNIGAMSRGVDGVRMGWVGLKILIEGQFLLRANT